MRVILSLALLGTRAAAARVEGGTAGLARVSSWLGLCRSAGVEFVADGCEQVCHGSSSGWWALRGIQVEMRERLRELRGAVEEHDRLTADLNGLQALPESPVVSADPVAGLVSPVVLEPPVACRPPDLPDSLVVPESPPADARRSPATRSLSRTRTVFHSASPTEFRGWWGAVIDHPPLSFAIRWRACEACLR